MRRPNNKLLVLGIRKPNNEQLQFMCFNILSYMFCYKINFLLTENGENLVSAQPRISAHLE